MTFLPPNQQCQSTEGNAAGNKNPLEQEQEPILSLRNIRIWSTSSENQLHSTAHDKSTTTIGTKTQTTTTTVLLSLYSSISTDVSWHPKLNNGGFCWSKVLLTAPF